MLDILITAANLVPVTVTSRTGRWVLGPALCVIMSVVTRYLYFTELLVVSFISLHRLRVVLLRKAGRPSSLQRRRQILCTKIFLGIVFALPLVPVSASLFGPSQVEFVAMYLSCTVPAAPKAWEYVALSYLILPSAVVIVCNLVITYKILTFNSRRSGGFFSSLKIAINPGTKAISSRYRKKKLNHSTYLTIILICMVFMITYSPVYVLVATSDHESNHTPSQPWLGVLSIELLSLNLIANPIVYTLSNTRFRRYVINLLQCKNPDTGTKKFGDDETSSEGFISSFFSTARTSVASMRASVVSASRTSTVRISKLSSSSKCSLRSKPSENYSSADQLKVGLGGSTGAIDENRTKLSHRTINKPIYRRAKSWNAVPAISENDQELSSQSSGRSITKPKSCSSILGKAANKDQLPAIVMELDSHSEPSGSFSGGERSEITRCNSVLLCTVDSVFTADLPMQMSETESRKPSCKKTNEEEQEDSVRDRRTKLGSQRDSERRIGVVSVDEVPIHNNLNRGE